MTELHCHMVTEEEQAEVTVLRKSWDLTGMMRVGISLPAQWDPALALLLC